MSISRAKGLKIKYVGFLCLIKLLSSKLKLSCSSLPVSRRRIWSVKIKLLLFFPVRDESGRMAKAVFCSLSGTGKGKGKLNPCTGTEDLYRPYGP